MTKICYFVLTLLFIPICVNSQTISDQFAANFIETLIHNPDELVNYIDPQELYISNRLGISYADSPQKFMISYSFNDSDLDQIREGELNYRYEIRSLGSDFSKLVLQLNDADQQTREFYFFKNQFISPLSYHIQNWSYTESEYFRFYTEYPHLTNAYAINKLDFFVEEVLNLLNVDEDRKKLLKREKFIYVLSQSEESIREITGYSSRGQYNLASDAIITTYNAHFHEAVHGLINFKLKENFLFTHPFFSEGLAVALGGRGGLNKEPLFTFSDFALQQQFLEGKQLLDITAFSELPPSISYPVSGFLINHLISEIGVDSLLELYKNYGAHSLSEITNPEPELLEIPDSSIKKYELLLPIQNTGSLKELNRLIESGAEKIYSDNKFYYFNISDTLLIKSNISVDRNYRSSKFEETFPESDYEGEQYLAVVNESEISFYNLFTNQLITNYVIGFQNEPILLPNSNNQYCFKIKKSSLDGMPVSIRKVPPVRN